jgi:hypothetical protein
MEILRDLPPRSGLGAALVAGRLKAIFDEVKGGISEAVSEELNLDEKALDESKLKIILESRTTALLKEVQAEVFRLVLDWHRDILMLVSGVDASHLVFSEEQNALVEQAKRHTPASALQAVQMVEAMAHRLDRNIPPLQVFDEAFRKLVRR